MACLLDVYRRLFGFRRISVVAGHAVPPAANDARSNLVICLAALSAFASKQMHARRSYLSVVVLMKCWRITLNKRATDNPSLGLPPLPQVTHAAATLGRSDAPQAEQYQSLSRTLYELSQHPSTLERFLADSGRSTDSTGSGQPVAGSSSKYHFALPSAAAVATAGLPLLEVKTPPGFARTAGFSDFLNTVGDPADLFPGAAWDGPSLADLFDFGQVGDPARPLL
ncbi:hypothetical protein JCM3770_002546, partial [Rhodotorula araucariae]